MRFAAVCLALLCAALPLSAYAQNSAAATPAPQSEAAITPQAALDRLLRAPHSDPNWFTPEFLAQVSTLQIDEILGSILQQLGAYQSVHPAGNGFDATYAHGTAHFLVALDERGRFEGLRYTGATASGSVKLSDVLSALQQLPGRVSYVVIENGKERAAFGQGSALGVGSTFKLAILNALRDAFAKGAMHATDVVHLQKRWKSLPSGMLQDWPTGSALTIETLASLMISQSDNTATDALIDLLGRKNIEPLAGANVPLLSTRNMFTLKSAGATSWQRIWRTGTLAQKRALVAKLDAMPAPSVDSLETSPGLSDIEWHFTNRTLCSLLGRVADLPLTQINAGVADKATWKRVSYKGGSDFGVISMTTDAVAKNGTHYCISVTENDSAHAIDENAFTLKYSALLSALSSGKITP